MSARLPATVVPSHYALHLTPDLSAHVFSGVVSIHVDVTVPTDVIVLNALELELASATITSSQQQTTWTATAIEVKAHPTDTATLQFGSAIPAGPAVLTIVFTGVLNDKLAGFYRSTYVVNGETRTMATTQFEATDARRAFPCWDEPAIKATFDVTIVAPANRTVLSNMPPKQNGARVLEGGLLQEVAFERTPVMSTYLLAFIVGEFDHVEAVGHGGVVVRVYTPLGKRQQGEFALQVAVKALAFYTKLFRIPYPLPKMDLIAIADFAAGAMENWGLITYREVAVLIDPSQSALDRRQRVARTTCHEIAHQWFGNLVTMEWWTHLWLNEGFARFLEFCAVDSIFPEWTIWLQFVQSVQGTALRYDAMESSHPIEVPVNHPNEINEIFDIISYAKGASVIRMLCDYLGQETFFNGLNKYLTRFAYKNASTADLWAAMEEASGKKVKDLMGLWTSKIGYPVLTIDDNAATVHQDRFLSSGSSSEGKWCIPVKLQWANVDKSVHSQEYGVLEEDGRDLYQAIHAKANDTANVAWVKLNAGQDGFYRVLYPARLQDNLAGHIADVPINDRLGLLMDAFALGRTGRLPIGQLMSTLSKFQGDRSFPVWSEITQSLEGMYRLFSSRPEIATPMRTFIIELLAPVKEWLEAAISTAPKDQLDSLNQFYSQIHSFLVVVNEPTTIKASIAAFVQHQQKVKEIHPDLRQSVYCAFVQAGGAAEYEQVLEIYKKSDLSEEKRRCLLALGATTDVALLKRTIGFAISPDVRAQDVVAPISSVASNVHNGHELAWSYFVEHFAAFDKGFNTGGQSFLLSGIVGSVAPGHSFEHAKAVEAFFAEHPWPAANKAVNSAIESTKIAAARLERDGPLLLAWLTSRV